jgi:Arc/MetJ family transcription regulator
MMQRTTVNVDTELLEQAAKFLGTTGTTATINQAMREIVRRKHLESLATWDLNGMTPEDVKAMRRREDGLDD